MSDLMLKGFGLGILSLELSWAISTLEGSWETPNHQTQNPGNHSPEFQAKFGVAEEEADGSWARSLKRLSNHAF